MPSALTRAVIASLAAFVFLAPTTVPAQGAQRVYVAVADSVPMSVPAASAALADALTRQGWTVLANHVIATDSARCKYAAHVIVASQAARATALLAQGAQAAFAIPVRVEVFEDERGVHVAMVNPLSVERTMVAESGLEASGRALVDDIAGIAAAATHGRRVDRPFGQSRNRGLIGKTMGVMAGGPFARQIETLTSVPGSSPTDIRHVADDIWRRMQQPAPGKWQLRAVYKLDLADQGLVIIGVSGAPMETKAFQIVGAGDDDTRSRFSCPGMAYAAAFPLELVVRREGAQVNVEAVGAMFRMKMYFEDAGQMKFARNMMMPGSIAGELKAAVLGRAP